jgi:hypothetical protein
MKASLFSKIGAPGFLASAVIAARAADVSIPAKRQEALNSGKTLLAPGEATVSVKDPFHSEAFIEILLGSRSQGSSETPVVRPQVRTDRDILQAIAANLKPSGYFVLGGQPTLVFGQKRVKAGGSLVIPFEGTDYTLEVVSIERPNFTLRLNREEFTRPIK